MDQYTASSHRNIYPNIYLNADVDLYANRYRYGDQHRHRHGHAHHHQYPNGYQDADHHQYANHHAHTHDNAYADQYADPAPNANPASDGYARANQHHYNDADPYLHPDAHAFADHHQYPAYAYSYANRTDTHPDGDAAFVHSDGDAHAHTNQHHHTNKHDNTNTHPDAYADDYADPQQYLNAHVHAFGADLHPHNDSLLNAAGDQYFRANANANAGSNNYPFGRRRLKSSLRPEKNFSGLIFFSAESCA